MRLSRQLCVRFRFFSASLTLGLILLASGVRAASPVSRPSLEAVRVAEPPRLDGHLTDDCWSAVPRTREFLQASPIEGGAPSESTEIQVAYDSQALYVAVRCLDRNPEALVVTELARDGAVGRDDHITLVLDTFRDRRNAYRFRVNAAGARSDALIANNTEVN